MRMSTLVHSLQQNVKHAQRCDERVLRFFAFSKHTGRTLATSIVRCHRRYHRTCVDPCFRFAASPPSLDHTHALSLCRCSSGCFQVHVQ